MSEQERECTCQSSDNDEIIKVIVCAIILVSITGYETHHNPDKVVADCTSLLTEFINKHYKPIN